MKNIIIVAHFSNSIFTRLDIQCSNKCSISATLVVKLKRSLACLDFLWTAKPVQAKITLWGVLIECDFHQSECCSEQKLIQWRARAFNWKPCLSRKTKTKLGNKNGYFFEIFSSSRRFHYKTLSTPNGRIFWAYLYSLLILNFSLCPIWKQLKTIITLGPNSILNPSTFPSVPDRSEDNNSTYFCFHVRHLFSRTDHIFLDCQTE